MTTHRDLLKQSDPETYNAMLGEEARQRRGIELIPSENYTYPEVLACLGSVFTNKYSEGYPGRRYYGGQQYTDIIENVARRRAKELFRAEHANVQPLSGSPMNQAVYMAFLEPGDTVLGMDLSHGGHLTHGAPVSHMGKIYNFIRYKTFPEEAGRIDFDELRKTALAAKPKIVLCGYSSYPRDYDYVKFKEIADEVGALTMADVSHIGGLIAGGVMRNPCDAGFDFVTTTTHKSMRGPRGGMIVCKKEIRKRHQQVGLSRPAGRAAHEPGGGRRRHVREGATTGIPGVLPAGPHQRQGACRNPDGGRGRVDYRRDRESHDGDRRRLELRDRRPCGGRDP